MPPFASPHQVQTSRFPGNPNLSYLTENLSLSNNNNNHSPPASNSGGQSPNQNNSPESPSLSRVDRTASRYAFVDNSAKMQNENNNHNGQYSMDKARFDNPMSQSHQGLASPWFTNMQSASQNSNANLHSQASENSYSSGGTAMPSSFDPSTLSYALAIQQAMLQQGPHSIHHGSQPGASQYFQPGAANPSSNPTYACQLGSIPGAQPGHFYNPIDLPQTIITERALQSASSYGFYRGNGQYTRLVPLDELPPIAGLPALAPMNGMIILPIPRQHQAVKIPTNAWAGGMGPITPNSASTGSGSSGGIGGRHFDAFAPLGGTPGGFGAGGSGGAFPTRNGSGGFGGGGRMANLMGTPSGRREKIYCDKWVHDGVCAFAQQGCKYKHEMPLDVPTQRSLGLFHGLPSWWKREHGIEMKRLDGGGDDSRGRRSSEVERQRESVRESLRAPINGDRERGTLSSWRIPVEKRTVTPSNNSVLSQPSAPRAGGLFGNIGPRTTSGGTKSHLSNSYSVLDVEDPTSPVSSNGHDNNNGGIVASMHAPFSPTPGHGKVNGGGETNGGEHGAFPSDKGGK